ncbi:trypsin-like peptidase domain-containing protein [Sorangium sp. So ce861]|uniref:trypsin-like peptidase domain-containing protein n=1 Tax=Sorangium sp. So ce861 TaxID=3133323 RepID=UPI003F5EEDD2
MNSRRLTASLALLVPALSLPSLAGAQPSAAPAPAPTLRAPSALPKAAPSPAPPRAAAPSAAAASSAAAAAGAADLRRLGEAFADVADKVGPTVVQIEVAVGEDVSSPLRWFRDGGQRRGLGSGVIFSPDGGILTNNHVIDGARAITVRLRDGRMFAGRVAGRDPATDLAVLRVDAKDLPTATFADSDAARVGAWVVAIGSPFGLGHTVTTGVLSAKGRGGVGVNDVEDYLQTDASINPGNSGGPLVDLDGRVLGINTMIVSRGQGIGLAVPANMARRVAEQLLRHGRVERAWIGVGLQDLTPQLAAVMPNAPRAGALVNAVNPSGPAARSNLQPGDVITSVAARPTRDAQDVIRELFNRNVGETLSLEVVRGGQRYQTRVTLAARNEPPPPALPVQRAPAPHPGLGLTLRDAPAERGDRDRGDRGDRGEGRSLARGERGERGDRGEGRSLARVAFVANDSPAERAGLRPGDVILEADGRRAPTAAEVEEAARDGELLVRVQRRGAAFYAALKR